MGIYYSLFLMLTAVFMGKVPDFTITQCIFDRIYKG